MGFRKREEGRPHLTFDCVKDTGKTKVWKVHSTHPPKPLLGVIRWYWPWRRYVFYPGIDTLYDVDCMNTISKFIDKEMKKRKRGAEARR